MTVLVATEILIENASVLPFVMLACVRNNSNLVRAALFHSCPTRCLSKDIHSKLMSFLKTKFEPCIPMSGGPNITSQKKKGEITQCCQKISN